MTITFENDNDVIVYALEKIIAFTKENQYLVVANCAWWIAGVTGLDSGLTIFIDNLESRRRVGQRRQVSTTPRDSARSVSVDQDLNKVEEELIGASKERNRKDTLRTIRTNQIQKLSKSERKMLARAKQAKGKN
jgi:hypothetical protein